MSKMRVARLRLPLHHPELVARHSMITHTVKPRSIRIRSLSSSADSLPKLAQPSVWTAMVPKFFRNRISQPATGRKVSPSKSKEWNPASFFIIIFILIGSQAIRMIALKNDFAAYTRTTDAKIALLREVIERIKRGEDVDVEKLLGTGDEAKEREWEEVLREIEEEDSLWHKKAAQADKEQERPRSDKDSTVKMRTMASEGTKSSSWNAWFTTSSSSSSSTTPPPSTKNEDSPAEQPPKKKVNFF